MSPKTLNASHATPHFFCQKGKWKPFKQDKSAFAWWPKKLSLFTKKLLMSTCSKFYKVI